MWQATGREAALRAPWTPRAAGPSVRPPLTALLLSGPRPVRGASDLPAGAVVHLVRQPAELAGQQQPHQGLHLLLPLPDHAGPVPGLLDCPQVQGEWRAAGAGCWRAGCRAVGGCSRQWSFGCRSVHSFWDGNHLRNSGTSCQEEASQYITLMMSSCRGGEGSSCLGGLGGFAHLELTVDLNLCRGLAHDLQWPPRRAQS